ncbi:MAG: UTP--glucose-1-phosphate uridylyltransferase [Actinobacteria bacterium]|nr:UTP--glucose-1-phosphate uridylyltransferase [Actinomycetota bacterium]NBO34420.1 UTP--glucose-1-phosphate uridylyltransferase [Actinomycetota bacterium]
MSNRGKIHKAVIPVAGLGTRFLPATKATPKEMLPVVDKPAIQYVVEEAVAAGISDVLFVTGRNKESLENHFDRSPSLERTLAERGASDMQSKISGLAELAAMHYVRQGVPMGLGHAVSMAKPHVGNQAFAVLLGDDLVDAKTPILPDMFEAQEKFGGSILALMEVPEDQIHLYGCAAVEPTDNADFVRVTELVEKPAAGTAPSNLAVIGRYVIDPAIFDLLENLAPGRGGEIQLTDALAELIGMPAESGGGVHAVIFRGKRYDTGDKLSYLKSVVSIALDRDDLGPDLRAWLTSYLAGKI